ncbi:Planctomycete cytochrome C [Symmachiella macrocystis]|uniref:Planctomycete cytochrome C n=1 Tax=Symmachiella macrocystis TaxID=2527985 RepID=A0A5C6B811_9PLAN|nr:DUF1553 domain-containing protein [Symmachiella macrocystis]TWU06654.1 Planctomycete cytochrome C [Symmachiella macrocystis]
MFTSNGLRRFAVLLTVASSMGGQAWGDDAVAAQSPRIDFARDVRPIFAEHCMACHGEKVQEAEFSVDTKQLFLRGGDSGKVIEPGNSDDSLLLARIIGDEQGDRMPLDADRLTAAQVATIRAWIDQGADWPDDADSGTIQHWAFEKPQRLEPPVGNDKDWPRNPIDAFVLAKLEANNLQPSPAASKEQLLRRVSLDLIGLPPTIAEIDAFLADDSPEAYDKVVDRLLASPQYGERWALPWLDAARFADSNGYQRDGRREAWSYRDWVIRALNDNMPFDQFTIEQIAGDLLPNATLPQRIASGFHRNTMANVEAGTDVEEQRVLSVFDRVNTTGTVWLGITIQCAQCHDHKYDPISQADYYRLFAFFNNTEAEIEVDKRNRDFVGPKMELPEPQQKTAQRRLIEAEWKAANESLKVLKSQLVKNLGAWETDLPHLESSEDKFPQNIREILTLAAEKRDSKQQKQLTEFYLRQFASYQKLADRQQELKSQSAELAVETTLVMAEQDQPRMTHVFNRGDFLNPGEAVQPGTPSVLHPFTASAEPNRLDLARWLVDQDNPLIARVTVNRFWAEFFGQGLVNTPEDFGTQGSRPTHSQLLDWLATEFMDSGWKVKAMHRLIATSATYRQASKITPPLLEQDPYNRLYARGPRFRMRAELIRDNALAVSGLLSDKMHGPPVFPRQPEGIWNHIGRTSNLWKTSTGEDLYRRGVYVYWRRTVPYPSFVNFDAPSREACVVQRSRSNTPLQALTLMNDPVFVEAAAALSRRLLTEHPEASPTQRVDYAFRLATGRRPHAAETAILTERYERELARYQQDAAAAEKMADSWIADEKIDPAEFAAWLHVANILLNLDEVITKG